jgi:hypothetical protein
MVLTRIIISVLVGSLCGWAYMPLHWPSDIRRIVSWLIGIFTTALMLALLF